MAVVMNAKPRSMWMTAIGALVLIWTLWALQGHSTRSLMPPPSVPNSQPAHNSGIKSSSSSTRPANGKHNTTVTDRPLILYAYFETENSRGNLEFFLRHGLHAGADFLFILNGENKAEDIIPKEKNIRWVHRPNDCYDLGAFAEVLLKDDLYKRYNRYITMNASIRGPFLPYWATGCWSDMYLDRVTEVKKLVGMTFNCHPNNHVQSMIWATDRVGMEILLFPTEAQIEATRASLPPHNPDEPVPPFTAPGINSCPHQYWDAVAVEVYSTPLIKAAGYDVDVIMTAFHKNDRYQEECFRNVDYKDTLYEGTYFGTTIHPYDTVFAKANRGTNALVLERLSEWIDGSGYSSYDHCPS
ncbi:hypothetical protein HYFRA_00008225 [Hymenoscyphus fraxineus]|uniref:Uncharacterized protein n=1 Tax=Hymenoscyphus fraxineus TaxID=746836 RepID=A0A9N9L539_9HELO|nr:hypothetical protein HYFRA_00008225 [Hymenoscyphus fraxineus]